MHAKPKTKQANVCSFILFCTSKGSAIKIDHHGEGCCYGAEN